MNEIPIGILSKSPKELTQRDVDIIYEAISNNLKNFNSLHQELKENEEFLYEMAKSNYLFVDYYPENMKNNYNLMLKTLRLYNDKINIVGGILMDNEDFIRDVIEFCPKAIYYSSDRVKQNRDFIYELTCKIPSIYSIFIDIYPNDEAMILKAIEHNADVLNAINPLWKSNENIARVLINRNPENMLVVSGKFGSHRELVIDFLDFATHPDMVDNCICDSIAKRYRLYYENNNNSGIGFSNILRGEWLMQAYKKREMDAIREEINKKISMASQ